MYVVVTIPHDADAPTIGIYGIEGERTVTEGAQILADMFLEDAEALLDAGAVKVAIFEPTDRFITDEGEILTLAALEGELR